MKALLLQILPHLTNKMDWSQWDHIIDIGGGNGTLATALKTKHPDKPVSIYDRPTVLKPVKKELIAAGINPISGDFLDPNKILTIPPNSILVLSRILHDWSDEKAETILGNLRHKANPDTTILLVEMLLDEENLDPSVTTRDITMMLLYGDARERTLVDFQKLLQKTRWQYTGHTSTPKPHFIIEAQAF